MKKRFQLSNKQSKTVMTVILIFLTFTFYRIREMQTSTPTIFQFSPKKEAWFSPLDINNLFKWKIPLDKKNTINRGFEIPATALNDILTGILFKRGSGR